MTLETQQVRQLGMNTIGSKQLPAIGFGEGVGSGGWGRIPLGNREGLPSSTFLFLSQKKKASIEVEGEDELEDIAGEEEESGIIMGEDTGEDDMDEKNEGGAP